MRAIIEGLLTVFKHLFMKPVTLEYPEKKRNFTEEFRGKLTVSGCIGCGICKKVCPSNAIEYIKDVQGNVISYGFNLNKCIFCGNCMYYCPHKAIKMTQEYELGTDKKNELCLIYKGEQSLNVE